MSVLGGSRSRVAGGLDAADDGVFVGDDGRVLQTDVACTEFLVETEAGDVYGHLVRKVGHQGADTEFACRLEELATLLNTDGVSGDLDRDVDAYRLCLVDSEEIHVEAFVADRVPLEFVEDCGLLSAVVEGEVNDVRSRCVGQSAELFGVDGEKYILHAAAVEVAWHETLLAESLKCGLSVRFADLAFKFEMLHFFNS